MPPQTELTAEQKARANRAQWILYLVIGIFVILPFLLYWLKRR
jgi:hypothetical protein